MNRPSTKYILVIEDEETIRDLIRLALEMAGFSVIESGDYTSAQTEIAKQIPNLILVDWMLPGKSGIKVTEALRDHSLTRNIPIIMLTAKAEEENKIKGLEAGADDYIVKPFSPRELVARIKTVLRRGVIISPDEIIEVGGIKIDTAKNMAYANNHELVLGPTEYRLLHFFLTHPNRVYSRALLLSHVWGQQVYVDERTVDVCVLRLRKILEPFDYAKHIQTVRGSGYQFHTEVQ